MACATLLLDEEDSLLEEKIQYPVLLAIRCQTKTGAEVKRLACAYDMALIFF